MRILAIGDSTDNNYTLKKFAKKSRVHLIDFPKKEYTQISNITSGREYFDSLLIAKQVKKIKEIKDNYDLCIVMSWAGARIAYLAGINYIMYFTGSDIGSSGYFFCKSHRWITSLYGTLSTDVISVIWVIK